MSVNAFDTNVLVYACDKSDPRKRQTAEQVLAGGDGVMLWQAACEFIAATRKLSGQGFSPTDAWRHLGILLDLMPLVLPSRLVLERARRMHIEQQWSYWDALLVAASIEAGVTRLYTEDMPGRTPPEGLEIINPFA